MIPRIPYPKSRIGKGTAAAVIAVSLIGGFEGLRTHSYQDVVGVWTACYGETRGIHEGMTFTKAECDKRFLPEIQKHEAGMRECLKDPDKLPLKVYLSALSLTYNIGVNGFCSSTAHRRFNNGDLKGGCEAIGWFTHAGGRVVNGLVFRRKKEVALCLEGAAGQ